MHQLAAIVEVMATAVGTAVSKQGIRTSRPLWVRWKLKGVKTSGYAAHGQHPAGELSSAVGAPTLKRRRLCPRIIWTRMTGAGHGPLAKA